MQYINVCVVTTPMSDDVIDQDILDAWYKTAYGKWVKENASIVNTHIDSSWADESFVIKIVAGFEKEQYIRWKLTWSHEV